MNNQEAIKIFKIHRYEMGLPNQGSIWKANADTIACDLAITALEAQQADMWIPISSGRLPENEKEVDVTVERRLEDGDKRTFTCRAVYEDGTVWSEESIYNWENYDNEPYDDEREDYKVPQGWFESVTYAEETRVIDDYIIAWKPIDEPWKEE